MLLEIESRKAIDDDHVILKNSISSMSRTATYALFYNMSFKHPEPPPQSLKKPFEKLKKKESLKRQKRKIKKLQRRFMKESSQQAWP